MATFPELLLEHAQAGSDEKRKQIETAIWEQFGVETAILVLDMSGFSQLTLRYGVVHYLSMVKRMQVVVEPIIERHDGNVVKFEADNCFARFPDTENAVRACIEMNRGFDTMNLATPEEKDIRISCGIDFGRVLLVEDDTDYFGNAVNRASKLGEDLAGPGEILVTDDAMSRLSEDCELTGNPLNFSISGIDLEASQIEYE